MLGKGKLARIFYLSLYRLHQNGAVTACHARCWLKCSATAWPQQPNHASKLQLSLWWAELLRHREQSKGGQPVLAHIIILPMRQTRLQVRLVRPFVGVWPACVPASGSESGPERRCTRLCSIQPVQMRQPCRPCGRRAGWPGNKQAGCHHRQDRVEKAEKPQMDLAWQQLLHQQCLLPTR